MPRIAIVGATGYSALELIQILMRHPHAELTYLAARRDEGKPIGDEFAILRNRVPQTLQPIDAGRIAAACDVAFLCLPNGLAMDITPPLVDAGVKVIDLSADYRLRDAAEYEQVYKKAHTDAARLTSADVVYGLPELFRGQIRAARVIGNPGCYATAVALAAAPLLRAGLVDPASIIAYAASGVSGAGREAKPEHHYPERAETFEPYNLGVHRHQPEIEQTLRLASGEVAAGPSEISVLFCPHLIPMVRGILATVTATLRDPATGEAAVRAALEQAYAAEPFIRLRSDLPSTRDTAGTNYVDIAIRVAKGRAIVVSAEDNLVKGAAGQAVQNMNILFDLTESAGLL